MELMARVPDFDRPIEALYICHDNILRRIELMDAMAEEILCEGRLAFQYQMERWREIFSFFEHSVGNHTRDEEAGLFPMLEGKLPEEVALLHGDHERAAQLEFWLSQTFNRFSEGMVEMEALIEFARRARELAHFYRIHIGVENEVLFPAARRLLTEEQMQALGAMMRSHRMIELHPPIIP